MQAAAGMLMGEGTDEVILDLVALAGGVVFGFLLWGVGERWTRITRIGALGSCRTVLAVPARCRVPIAPRRPARHRVRDRLLLLGIPNMARQLAVVGFLIGFFVPLWAMIGSGVAAGLETALVKEIVGNGSAAHPRSGERLFLLY